MDEPHTLYEKSCNIVDMIVSRWRDTHTDDVDGSLSALGYGTLVRQVAEEMFKMSAYRRNIELVRSLADGDDTSLHITEDIPGDLSDLFDVFGDDDEEAQ